jgi:hypothetical protein
MTPPVRLLASVGATLLAAVLSGTAGCDGVSPQAGATDLAATLDRAERRPEGGPFEVHELDIDGQQRPVIAVPATSRLTWHLRFPARARLRMWLGARSACDSAPVDFRVGISDGRVYEQLLVRAVAPGASGSPGWGPATIDLSRYGGTQWSLFYRPSEITWSLIFNTRPSGAMPCASQSLWGAPQIETGG